MTMHKLSTTAWPTAVLLLTLVGSSAWAEEPAYSAAGLYNLANSYARAGNPAMAVLNYERASLLAPGDPDIEANLRLVRATAKLPPEVPVAWERLVEWASPTVLAWTGLLGIAIAGGCLLARRTTPRFRGLRLAGIAVGVTLAAMTAGNAWLLWPTLHAAVVLAAATPARVSPVPMGEPVFTLPEADTVTMTAEHEGFVLVRTRSGKTGWVASASLAPVVPR